ncbi:hypothetical protein DAMNIGENAA_38460 [Desulforhabdus amnigena]|jgi:hypothetical protein|uniref:Uncharacterized protein n=2 Tax=Desulforhabdus amnigena TaxID=40218 RepID=A0A9W6FX41_9BACT|nr:hypothetical protein DAMNIGENAA_38460 [Desulforhabdus amnigena]
MFILTGVPGIVGGGLVWSLLGNWPAILVYELILLCAMSVVIIKGGKASGRAH